MKKLSIGLRLALWYVAIFALGQVAFGTGMWLVLRHHLVSIVDDDLRDQMEDLQVFLDSQKKDAGLAKFQEEVTETYSQEHAGEYLAVMTSAGEVVYISDALKTGSSAVLTGLNQPGSFEHTTIHGKRLRFLRSSISSHGFIFLVRLGLPTNEVWNTLDAFRNYLLLLAPLMLLISAGGGYWLSHRALAPVAALIRSARTISGSTLSSRLEKLNTGDELQNLSDTLNGMLDRIEKTFQRVTQFTADASHELRTPISLMRTEAEIALRRSRDVQGYQEALQHILAETERTSVLIDNLLAIARADSGREYLDMQPMQLTGWLQSLVMEWEGMAGDNGRQLSVNVPELGEVWVIADAPALRRVLAILLDNAFKYSGSLGRIEVSLEKQGGSAVISVSDDGIGIPVEEQAKIFERFYRVDKARSRAVGGAGLGLAIAQWVVARHGGSITVISTEDRGSRFSFGLKVVSGPIAPKFVSGATRGEWDGPSSVTEGARIQQ